MDDRRFRWLRAAWAWCSRRHRDQADAEYRTSEDWEKRAMLAIQEGRDDLAKQALVRQGEHASHAQQLEATSVSALNSTLWTP